SENILAQHLNRVFTGSCVRSSVAPCVIAQNLEVRKQVCYLRFPHRMVGADRVRQNQDRPSRVSLKSVKHPRIVNGCEGQIITPCRSLRDRTLRLELFGRPLPTQDIAQVFPTAGARQDLDVQSLQVSRQGQRRDSFPPQHSSSLQI